MAKQRAQAAGRPRGILPGKTCQVATRYSRVEYDLITAAATATGQEFGPFLRTIAVPAARAVMTPPDVREVER